MCRKSMPAQRRVLLADGASNADAVENGPPLGAVAPHASQRLMLLLMLLLLLRLAALRSNRRAVHPALLSRCHPALRGRGGRALLCIAADLRCHRACGDLHRPADRIRWLRALLRPLQLPLHGDADPVGGSGRLLATRLSVQTARCAVTAEPLLRLRVTASAQRAAAHVSQRLCAAGSRQLQISRACRQAAADLQVDHAAMCAALPFQGGLQG